jgi:serine/threonine protein phosphatase PrpC
MCCAGAPVLLAQPHTAADAAEEVRINAAGGWVMCGAKPRVNGHLAISRALGDFEYKMAGRARLKGIDTTPLRADVISSRPDVACVPLSARLRFAVLASDGLWDALSKAAVARRVHSWLDAESEKDRMTGGPRDNDGGEHGRCPIKGVAQALVDEAIRRGSRDDVTVIVVHFRWDAAGFGPSTCGDPLLRP